MRTPPGRLREARTSVRAAFADGARDGDEVDMIIFVMLLLLLLLLLRLLLLLLLHHIMAGRGAVEFQFITAAGVL